MNTANGFTRWSDEDSRFLVETSTHTDKVRISYVGLGADLTYLSVRVSHDDAAKLYAALGEMLKAKAETVAT